MKEVFKPIAQNPRVFSVAKQAVLLSLGTLKQMEEIKNFIKFWSEENRFFKGETVDSSIESIEHSFLEDRYFLEVLMNFQIEENFLDHA